MSGQCNLCYLINRTVEDEATAQAASMHPRHTLLELLEIVHVAQHSDPNEANPRPRHCDDATNNYQSAAEKSALNVNRSMLADAAIRGDQATTDSVIAAMTQIELKHRVIPVTAASLLRRSLIHV